MIKVRLNLDSVDRDMVLIYGRVGEHDCLLAAVHIDVVEGLLGLDVLAEIHSSLRELDEVFVEIATKKIWSE